MNIDNELLYKADKIILFNDKKNKYYFVHFSDSIPTVFIKDRLTNNTLYLRESEEAGPMSNFLPIVLQLLADGYKFSYFKNRSGIELSKNAINKYISLLKKYYGKNDILDVQFEFFFEYLVKDKTRLVTGTMNTINKIIKEMKENNM